MDRREALKKLSAGGAIAAGGSMVLSSTNVAYAMSDVIGPIPPPTATYSVSGPDITVSLNSTPPSCSAGTPTSTFSWGAPTGSIASGNQVIALANSSGATAVIRRSGHPQANKNAWNAGESFSIPVTVQWDCGDTSTSSTFTVQSTNISLSGGVASVS